MKRNNIFIIILGTLALYSCSSAGGGKRDVLQPVRAESSAEKSISQKLLALTNSHRKGMGLGKVSPNSELKKLATEHSVFLANLDNAGKKLKGKEHAGFRERAHHSQVKNRFSIAENVAWYTNATDPASQLFQEWLNSPHHRKAIENGSWEKVGLSVSQASDGTYYATQIFGKPFSQGLVIPISMP